MRSVVARVVHHADHGAPRVVLHADCGKDLPGPRDPPADWIILAEESLRQRLVQNRNRAAAAAVGRCKAAPGQQLHARRLEILWCSRAVLRHWYRHARFLRPAFRLDLKQDLIWT